MCLRRRETEEERVHLVMRVEKHFLDFFIHHAQEAR